MRNAFCIPALLLSSALAQLPERIEDVAYFTGTYEATLSSATDGVTIQIPAETARSVYPFRALIYCEQGCTINQTRNGTAATGATAVTMGRLNKTATFVGVVYGATNSTGGIVLPTVRIPADQEYPLTLNTILLERNQSTAQNYTIKLASAISGIFRVSLVAYQK